METKARIGLFVGGLVLVGMVAYVMMPRSAASKADDASTAAQTPSDSVDYAAAPSTQPAPATQPIAITDPFAAPAATPAVAGATDAAAGPTLSTVSESTQAAAGPTSGDDAWGRALDGGTTQTRSVGNSLSSHSSLLADASTMGTAASNTPSAQKTYKVEAGDSPFTISQKLYGDGKYASKIMAANPGVNAKRLKVGQELTIPDITARETATGSSVAGTADHTDPVPVAGAKTYKVQAGDTLSKISSKLYGKTSLWKQIYAANKSKIGADPTRLRAGMVLQIPDNVQ